MSYKQLSKHFHEREFACHHCGEVKVDPRLVDKLEELRTACGNKPITVLSGYRCQRHNTNVGGAPQSQHLLGKAADIVIVGLLPDRVAELAEGVGFGGIGRYDHFTHVDVRDGYARWDYRTCKGGE